MDAESTGFAGIATPQKAPNAIQEALEVRGNSLSHAQLRCRASRRTIIAGDESGRVHFLRLVEADETNIIRTFALFSTSDKGEILNWRDRCRGRGRF